MSTFRRLGLASLVLLGLLTGSGVARAQFAFGHTPFGLNLNNPYVAQQQYMYNLQLSRAASANSFAFPNAAFAMPYNVPAYNPFQAFNFNPYAASAALSNSYNPGLGGNLYNPGLGSNPYSPGLSGSGASYDPTMSNPYSPYSSSSYGSLGPGYALMGAADVMRSYGNVITKQEEARILRQQYYSAKLDNQKKKFDLDAYIRTNTPTYTEEQERIARNTLKRIQSASAPGEVVSGKSLNYLLDDVHKFRGKEVSLPPITLPDDVLKHVNVTTELHSLGILRDGGKLVWPAALQQMTSEAQRRQIEAEAQALVQGAHNGKRDANASKDLRIEVNRLLEQLLKKANDFDTGPYMEAKRFLTDLESSRMAIERGEAAAQLEFQKVVNEGKVRNINDLLNVMVQNGWKFSPALQTDEAAYRALHSALVAYDVALNSGVQTAQAPNQQSQP